MRYLRFLAIGILSIMLIGCSSGQKSITPAAGPAKENTAANSSTAEVVVSTPEQADEELSQLNLEVEQLGNELPSGADFDAIPTEQ
ncbi:MAG: hypothetical protein QMC95_14885 [Desulfitobacteriaceae bacterium]|nr:hypothetical protein [Desulfitobacteriaceae bacterium]MDI6915479.1 hypothetical protein [Desulfitobacteriaceae bacterium]